MKRIIAILITLLSANVWSYDNPDIKSKCFSPDKPNHIHSCTISSGGGAGGMYTSFKMNRNNYWIVESTMCEGEVRCPISLGLNIENMLSAKVYYRNFKTNKIMDYPKPNNWICYKQLHGKLHACYLL